MANILSIKLARAIERRKTKYVVCVEGKHEDLLTLYKLMSNEEGVPVALNDNKMYIICEDNEQAEATEKILSNEDGLYAYLV